MKFAILLVLALCLFSCAFAATNTEALMEKLNSIEALSQTLEEERESVLSELQNVESDPAELAAEEQLAVPEELSEDEIQQMTLADSEALTETESYPCGTAYSNGKALGSRNCVKVDGKAMTTTLYPHFQKLKAAAAKAGVTIRVNSGFRTMAEQQYFWNCYVTKKCNNGNLAARPGYSNHQNGIALDIDTRAFNWLRLHASKYGFVRTVASENWHWEYRAGSKCNSFVRYSCR